LITVKDVTSLSIQIVVYFFIASIIKLPSQLQWEGERLGHINFGDQVLSIHVGANTA